MPCPSRTAISTHSDRNAVIANDLTKKFEQVQRGTPSELLAAVNDRALKGEFILVIAGRERVKRAVIEHEGDDEEEGDDLEDGVALLP